jgi:hypothetical protein
MVIDIYYNAQKRELEEILKEKYELPLIADIKINSKEF